MKKLSEGIYGKLSGSTFASDIGNRFYKSQAPDGTQYPYAVYMMPTDIPEYTFSEAIRAGYGSVFSFFKRRIVNRN